MKNLLIRVLLMIGIVAPARAQFSDVDKVQGFIHKNDTTLFIFDTSLYKVSPERVVLTGAFRNWSQDMEDVAWQLEPSSDNEIWTLAVPNLDYWQISPGLPFKYRIDDGIWLDPPQDAPNVSGGNLIYLFGMKPAKLTATLKSEKAIWFSISGEGTARPLNKESYQLMDAYENRIPIAEVLPKTATETLLIPGRALNLKKNYRLVVENQNLETWVSHDGWFETLYSDKELGATVDEQANTTSFRIFAPRAEIVYLNLYHLPNDKKSFLTLEMEMDESGVWEAFVPSDLHKTYYDFRIEGVEIPGEPEIFTVSDPYARVNVEAQGKSRVWHKTQPATPLEKGIPNYEDVVAYEVHVQDFTDLLPIGEKFTGTISGMGISGLKNAHGEPIGFDHLTNLGINVVHLMPVQEFFNYPDDIWQEAFEQDSLMQAMGIANENYQWGYRTTHAFAVESKYREKGTEHGAQREQFRDLVQKFHDRGIAVIVDFVFNHTGENMEGLHWNLNFNGIDRLYYYRTKNFKHIGAFGNETKSENRPMVQRWIIDQCKHFIEEFGVDGFRIDLAGQTDKQTLRKLKEALGEEIIIYGEPWIGSNDPDFEENPDWDWYKADAPITFFQDDARNAFKGPVSTPNNKWTDRGFAGGNTAERFRTMLGLLNGFEEELDPNRGINYLDIHDNWALADQFATSDWDGREAVDEKPFKIAATLLFTSLGPLVIHGGTEFMRSKGVAPNIHEIIKETALGKIYIKGRGDTYNLRTPNQFVWGNIGKEIGSQNKNDYSNMLAYWKGLIDFRMSSFGKVFRIGGEVPPEYYQWIVPEDETLLGYLVNEKVLVLINVGISDAAFYDVPLPFGTWKLIADGTKVDKKGIGRVIENESQASFFVPAQSIKIFVKE